MTEAQRKKKSIEIHKITVGTFSTEIGKKCLDNLERAYIDRPIYIQGQTSDVTAYRQGQADVIKAIIREIENG